MEAPKQITPTKLADYLEILTKTAFEPGLNWQVIERKWPGFQAAFHGFDPERVANLSPDEVDALTSDERIVRSRKKIEATVHNAQAMIAAEKEFGTFKRYLEGKGEFETLVKDMRKRFKFVGDFGAYYFLYVVGEPVPEQHEYRAKLLEGAQKPKG
ncbi:MAG: DNA-3-methyladenine glycosylase I [Dehalococcoidia bacterium]